MSPVRSVPDLVRAGVGGQRSRFLFFWGHTAPPGARTGPFCLSQWWPSPFALGGREFATAEHYMMWRKAELFGDAGAAAAVLATPDPARAKAIGRTVRGFSAAEWERHAVDAVIAGNRAKFACHPDLASYLRGTADRILVEASPHDAVWGIGLHADHPDAPFPQRWPGTNLLGFALMRVREELVGAVATG